MEQIGSAVGFNRFKDDKLGKSGAVAEWLIATVLKTVLPQGNGGSNPSCSVWQGYLIGNLSNPWAHLIRFAKKEMVR